MRFVAETIFLNLTYLSTRIKPRALLLSHNPQQSLQSPEVETVPWHYSKRVHAIDIDNYCHIVCFVKFYQTAHCFVLPLIFIISIIIWISPNYCQCGDDRQISL